MGMGAHRMNVPRNMRKFRLERAEIAVCLPADWNIHSPDERDYWPIRWLKNLARLPIGSHTWLGYGHSVSGGGPFADNTALSEVMLDAFGGETGYQGVALPGGDVVRFWQMIPLYADELAYKMEHGADALLELFDAAGLSRIVDIARPSCLLAKEG
jgi:hypothetical protein